MALDASSLERIRPYVSNLDRRVFAITGLPEEVIAVLLAYYSRSRDDLRTNLARLLDDDSLALNATGAAMPRSVASAEDKARAFHEKWVVGYGHSSVAEHAVVHLAVEDVSIVASKVIEDLRLGSYTEKSTRYVVFDTGSFADLPSLPDDVRAPYRETCANLFATYLELFPIVQHGLRELVPQDPTLTPKARENVLRSHTCDLLRGLLPASTRTNLGITANARALGMLISKMLSFPLGEVRALGLQMREEARSVAPTLLRYADQNDYRASLRDQISHAAPIVAARHTPAPAAPTVRVVHHDPDALERIVLALTYDGATADAAGVRDAIGSMSREARLAIVAAAMSKRGTYDPPPRAFEAASVSVEMDLDYGAYRDLQRHRMVSPATQLLGCSLGAQVPDELEQLGVGARYREALDRAQHTWELLHSTLPFEAQYVVPLAYRVRTLWTLDLREVFHVVELRSGKQGHASYRRIAQQMYRAVCEVHPWLAPLIRVDLNEYRVARSG